MRGAGILLAAALFGFSTLAAPAAVAQPGAGEGWWEWAAPLVLGGQSITTPAGMVRIPGSASPSRARGHGPPFCRNGQGHPVHGPAWCIDRGWGLGSGAIWQRGGWEDVILRQPRGGRGGGRLDQRGLADVLGEVIFGRVENRRRQLGAGEPLSGRWLQDPSTGAHALQIRAGGVPIAEFTDLTGDGRADVVLLSDRH